MTEEAPGPLATTEHYRSAYTLPGRLDDRLDALLGRASRKVRGVCPDVDERIEAGLLDPLLVADIVCEIVEAATTAGTSGIVGAQSVQQGAGPFQKTITYADAVGRMFVGKEAKHLLGCTRQKAGSVNLLGGR